MMVRNAMRVCAMVLVASLASTGTVPVSAQENDHAVSSVQLRTDLQKASEIRQANEAAVRELFRSEKGRETLKSTGIDYQKVDRAIGQVSDGDLARMAERSRDVQKDFAAGRFSDRDLIIIMLIAVGLILVIVAVR